MREELRAGLSRILPPRRATFDVLGGVAEASGAFVRGELALRLAENVAALAYAEATTRLGHSAGVGVRVAF